MNSRWGNPDTCHFPLIPFVTAVPMPYMALVYLVLWLGALGITLGYKYSLASWTFTIAYWYLFLIEKSFWNNHSYLFGLVSFLLSFTQAGCFWSVDAYLDPSLKKTTVPYWNYFVLKYQFFILYFMAGLKKGTAEWLTGYSVNHLSEHWVFAPFKLLLTAPQINYLIVHWFIFVFDLTIAFWMMYSKTRHIAMAFCGLFHLMNIRLFSIGMFPWVCLSTMPLFYAFDWPKRVYQILLVWLLNHNKAMSKITRAICIETQTNKEKKCKTKEIKDTTEITKDDLNTNKEESTTRDKGDEEKESKNESKSRGKTILLILLFVFSQAFLPFSHFITKGYNNWTNGLYGYSWDMMVHTWDVNSVVIQIVDNTKQAEYYLDPYIFTPNNRWTRYGDMIHQYAHCLKDKFASKQTNISIYFDIWCSLNGRFTQRMFDDKIDMLNVSWSPFRPVSYLMPLLSEGYSWRKELQDIEDDVNSWNNNSDVLFVAEFPGYEQHKFIPKELVDVKLTALKGNLLYEIEMRNVTPAQLSPGMKVNITSNMFHRVKNTGSTPAFYMYTFTDTVEHSVQSTDPYLPIADEISHLSPNYSYIFDFENHFIHQGYRKWMIENWTNAFYYVGIYMAFIFGGQYYMQNRPRFELRRTLIVWNTGLALFSIMGACRTFPEFFHVLKNHGLYHSICVPR
ncbi:unnamed protein product [Pieris brassicae]|uniref:HTTM-like domain-containing protein n=1 Tax=Pieris brassicae TaxID=7116 RepID=A0A9P0X4V8_PIEBR|nr:unnamed protein product [Pieris brassicae]